LPILTELWTKSPGANGPLLLVREIKFVGYVKNFKTVERNSWSKYLRRCFFLCVRLFFASVWQSQTQPYKSEGKSAFKIYVVIWHWVFCLIVCHVLSNISFTELCSNTHSHVRQAKVRTCITSHGGGVRSKFAVLRGNFTGERTDLSPSQPPPGEDKHSTTNRTYWQELSVRKWRPASGSAAWLIAKRLFGALMTKWQVPTAGGGPYLNWAVYLVIFL
jgi:hypothetical protein